jgi:hypothetical protein
MHTHFGVSLVLYAITVMFGIQISLLCEYTAKTNDTT